MTAVTIGQLTSATVDGTGAFDVLMKATKAHLDGEFLKGRIKGPEYSTVYLGSLEQSMQTAVAFLLQNQKVDLELQLLTKQIALADVEVQKATAELAIIEAQLPKVAAEIAHIEAQTLLVNQQKTNLVAEALNIPKQGLLIDAQKDQSLQQTLNLVAEELGIDQRTALTTQQVVNAVQEKLVLVAQECKLQAEFDNIQAATLRVNEETALLTQKTATERAQILSTGVDSDSVIGRQKGLYLAQTTGFTRDAEQKAAKLLIDSWSVRRTTDEATVADNVNKLLDTNVGRAVDKLLAGVGA